MKFIVTRSSKYAGEKPCEGVEEADFSCYLGDGAKWTIELDLEQLKEFVATHEAVLITETSVPEAPLELEIYDRED